MRSEVLYKSTTKSGWSHLYRNITLTQHNIQWWNFTGL